MAVAQQAQAAAVAKFASDTLAQSQRRNAASSATTRPTSLPAESDDPEPAP
jgi:hypothetical protein